MKKSMESELLRQWIEPKYLARPFLREMQSWFVRRPGTPRLLKGFLRPERAEALADCLAGVTLWQRVRCVRDGETTREVTDGEWERTPPEQRFSDTDIARPLKRLWEGQGVPAGAEGLLKSFLLLALGPPMQSWVSRVVGVDVSGKITCEVARYGRGQFLREHSDTHDSRIAGANFYLGRAPGITRGGKLGFRNEQGEVFLLEAEFNSLSIFPVRVGCSHWVTEWVDEQAGRELVSVSYRPQ